MNRLLTFVFLVLLVSCVTEPAILPATNIEIPKNGGVAAPAIRVKANVTMLVGNVYYQNCDAVINVRGFDENGIQDYSEDLLFTGPEDTLLISKESASYSINLKIWGKSYPQFVDSEGHEFKMSFASLWEDRIDGPTPATLGFGEVVAIKKLKKTEEFFMNANDLIEDASRAEYQYLPNGSLDKIITSAYSMQTGSFSPQGSKEFIYGTNGLDKIRRFNGQNLVEEYTYHENVGFYRPGSITFKGGSPFGSSTTNAKFSFDNQANVKVAYDFSNGKTYTYAVSIPWKSIADSKGSYPGEVCSEGQYNTDKYINPFRHLGYLNFYADNISANNIVTESVNYIACGFPTLQPLSHVYTYKDGYPVTSETTYKGGNIKSKTYYYYVE